MKNYNDIKIDITKLSTLTDSANKYAEIVGYTDCLKNSNSILLNEYFNKIADYQKMVTENSEDEHIVQVFTEKINTLKEECMIIEEQVNVLKSFIPRYVFPTHYSEVVKTILNYDEYEKVQSDLMSAFEISTKVDADAFYSYMFCGVKKAGMKQRAGIWKDSDKKVRQDAEHVHYQKTLSRKQIEQNIICFICEKMASRKVYLFAYPTWLESDFSQLANQIETLYGDKENSRLTAIQNLVNLEKIPTKYLRLELEKEKEN